MHICNNFWMLGSLCYKMFGFHFDNTNSKFSFIYITYIRYHIRAQIIQILPLLLKATVGIYCKYTTHIVHDTHWWNITTCLYYLMMCNVPGMASCSKTLAPTGASDFSCRGWVARSTMGCTPAGQPSVLSSSPAKTPSRGTGINFCAEGVRRLGSVRHICCQYPVRRAVCKRVSLCTFNEYNSF